MLTGGSHLCNATPPPTASFLPVVGAVLNGQGMEPQRSLCAH